MTGYVKNHRKIEEWKFYKRDGYAHVWQHIIRQAHHSDTDIYDGHGNLIKKGQFSTGILRLAKETGVHKSKIERILLKLEIENQITRQRTNKCSVITIVNWDYYQSREADREASEKQVGCKREQNKNGKNGKNKYIDQIELIYRDYPRKEGKKRGVALLGKQISNGDTLARFEKAVGNYSNSVKGKAPKYIKHFSSFANCWEDYEECAENQQGKFNPHTVYAAISGAMVELSESEAQWIKERGGVQILGKSNDYELKRELGI